MADPTKTDLQELGEAVHEMRRDLEKKSVDDQKIENIQQKLDEHEEKFNQPLTRAIEHQEGLETEVKEFKVKLEEAGVSVVEAKARIDALEMQIAARSQVADDPFAYRETPEFKALQEHCVYGDKVAEEHKALLRTDINADGGFLVPSEMDTQLTKRITELDPMRSISRVRTISAKSLEMALRLTIPAAAYEGEAETGTDSASTYDNVTVVPYRQTFTTPITWDMLQDAMFSMEAEIMADGSEAFALGEGNGFVTGTGHKQPFGFLDNTVLQAAARETTASGVLDPESLILLTGDLKVGYDPLYVLNRTTLAQIRTMRADAVSAGDSASAFLWNPGMDGPVANTINGFRYVLMPSMPDVASSAYSVAFGDFRKGYTIVDRTGMSVIRDEVTLKKRAIVEFTMNRWNTGQVTLTEPIKLLKIKA
jgi:HK97 family phage major capsid protein